MTASADGKRFLIVGNDDFHAVVFFVQHDLDDFGGRQSVYDKGRGIGRPLNDVDFFALQFVDDRLNAHAAHTDAGADGINRRIGRGHRHFRARTGVAGNGFDFNHTVINFGNFLREQLRQKLRMRAGQKDLRPAGFQTHVHNVSADSVARAERFAANHFVPTQNGFGAADIDNHAARFNAFDNAVNDFADTVFILVILADAFGIADFLTDNLFRRLRRNTAEVNGRQLVDNEIADVEFRVFFLGFADTDLRRLVFDFGVIRNDFDKAIQTDFARFAVNLRANIVLCAVFRATRFLNRQFHRR